MTDTPRPLRLRALQFYLPVWEELLPADWTGDGLDPRHPRVLYRPPTVGELAELIASSQSSSAPQDPSAQQPKGQTWEEVARDLGRYVLGVRGDLSLYSPHAPAHEGALRLRPQEIQTLSEQVVRSGVPTQDESGPLGAGRAPQPASAP